MRDRHAELVEESSGPLRQLLKHVARLEGARATDDDALADIRDRAALGFRGI